MNLKLSGKALVIQIQRDNIRIIKTNLSAAVPQIMDSAVIPTPAGVVEDGQILQIEAIQEVLQPVLNQSAFKRVRQVVFSLCTTQVVSEQVQLPVVSANKLDKMLETNIDMYFPLDAVDYNVTWQIVSRASNESGAGEYTIQLWGVRKEMLPNYYALANRCGLSVAAIDYCANSLATAMGASFALPKTKKGDKQKSERKEQTGDSGEAEASTDAVQVAETQLYIQTEPEQLIMLFVQEDVVKLQRTFRFGPDWETELGEALMALEYYGGIEIGHNSPVSAILCGTLAEDEQFSRTVAQVLGIPVTVVEETPGPGWRLCLGAAKTTLDFGIPAMNRPGKVSGQISNAWQYALILIGGLALVAALVLTFGSKVIWSTDIAGLKNTQATLQIRAAQNSGYAQNYRDYQSAYNSYSSDWDTLFASLRTYNDNLVLMMEELETVLPETASVVSIDIQANGMSLGLACESKKEAAYTIMALRKLEYATLDWISDLSGSTGSPATFNGEIAVSYPDTTENTEPEAPPTKGSDMQQLLQMVISSGMITESDLEEAIKNGLTPEQLGMVEQIYGTKAETDYELDELLEQASLEDRNTALTDMFRNDLLAAYYFYELFKEDMFRPYGRDILYSMVVDDIMENDDLITAVFSGEINDIQAVVDPLVAILTKDEERLTATEELIMTGEKLSARYAYYLAVQLGLETKDNSSPDWKDILDAFLNGGTSGDLDWNEILDAFLNGGGSGGLGDLDWNEIINDYLNGGNSGDSGNTGNLGNLDWNEIINDYLNGGNSGDSGSTGNLGNLDWNEILNDYLNGDSDVQDILDQIVSDLMPPEIDNDILSDILSGNTENLFNPGEGNAEQVVDNRIFFDVTLGYKPALAEAERERKGLFQDAKLAELEVE